MSRDYSDENWRDIERDQDLLEEVEDERERLAKAPTLPALAATFKCVATCPCGAHFDALGWKRLRLVGVVPGDDGKPTSMKSCAFCGTTVRAGTVKR